MYHYEQHCFKTDQPIAKITGRAICVNCGLLRLKNKLTDWCVAKGCHYDEHPEYGRALRELPAQDREVESA